MYHSAWLQAFNGKGGVTRRSKLSIRQYSPRTELFEMVKEQNWHLIEIETHYIVI